MPIALNFASCSKNGRLNCPPNVIREVPNAPISNPFAKSILPICFANSGANLFNSSPLISGIICDAICNLLSSNFSPFGPKILVIATEACTPIFWLPKAWPTWTAIPLASSGVIAPAKMLLCNCFVNASAWSWPAVLTNCKSFISFEPAAVCKNCPPVWSACSPIGPPAACALCNATCCTLVVLPNAWAIAFTLSVDPNIAPLSSFIEFESVFIPATTETIAAPAATIPATGPAAFPKNGRIESIDSAVPPIFIAPDNCGLETAAEPIIKAPPNAPIPMDIPILPMPLIPLDDGIVCCANKPLRTSPIWTPDLIIKAASAALILCPCLPNAIIILLMSWSISP